MDKKILSNKNFPENLTDGHRIEAGPAKMVLKNLAFTVDEVPLLKNISLDIPEKKIVCLIGPSGSGKSTLLRFLNRLQEPTPQTVLLDQQDITTLDVLTLRCQVGLLLQSGALFPGTVASNIGYGPSLRQITLDAPRIDELLQMVGLPTNMGGKSVDSLSGGQAQRVALARTLANEPEVLLLDEPTSALDPAATLNVEQTVQRLRDELGLTVVWVSHSLAQVERVADYVVLLVDGEIVETGTPAHLLSGIHHHLTEDFAAGKLVSKREVV